MPKRKAKQVRKKPSWCGNQKHSHKPHINNGKCAPNGAKLPPKNCVMEEEHEFELFV